MSSFIAHLRLMRPANIITAIADIMAGFAVSGAAVQLLSQLNGASDALLLDHLLWLCLSTIGLYGGGVVFNDVFDADLDRKERPERPIPSGKASVTSASLLASALLAIGIAAAFQVSPISGTLAVGIAVLAVFYDAIGKHQLIFGPINMGLCRGGNLLLGVSAVPAMVYDMWYIALIPVVFIAAITMISRGEVHGGNRNALGAAFWLYGIIIVAILVIGFISSAEWWQVIPFLALFIYLIFPPLAAAFKTAKPQLIGKAVKAGVLSLVVMDASLAAAFAGWQAGVVILLLLPLSLWLARMFAVT